MSGEREGGGSGGGGGGGGGGNSSPKAQLHRLCSHLVGGAGGGAALISDHYKSGLQLLTSSSSYAQPLQESAVVERMQRKLVRAGRDREAADVSRLHSKLVSSSKEILRNRASILTLLYSLSENTTDKENIPKYFTGQNTLNTTSSLRTSRSVSGLSGYHPPLPPRPRSRPASLHEAGSGDQTETDSGKNLKARASVTTPGEQELVRELLYVFQVRESCRISQCFSQH